MKKTALTIILATIATVCAHSQSVYDAWQFSENNYEGTARSVAMGNAFTALGGDLGAVSINPAGSAVAGYTQISFTPSITFSTNTAVGVPYEGSTNPYFQNKMRSNMVRGGLPNIGFSFNFDTGRRSGIKNLTIAFVANQTNSWCEDIYAKGTNTETSFLAAAAADAQAELEWMNLHKAPDEADFTADDYLAGNAYDYMNWTDVVGYRGGLFSAINGDKTKLVGATELVYSGGAHGFEGKLAQTYGRSIIGDKHEYILNVGTNISDFVYIGFNLGMNTLDYSYSHYFTESPHDNVEEFENIFTDEKGAEHITYFNSATYKYNYRAEGSGVFAKLGVIVVPGNGLRLGAAIQTPTSTTINEEWQESAETHFTDASFDSWANSEIGTYSYSFSSPWRANFGLAYTIGNRAIISADYEMADFKTMKYHTNNEMSYDDIDYFKGLNKDIRKTYGMAHHFRFGAEIKPSSAWAIRAGYNLSTTAQIKEKVFDYDMEKYIYQPTERSLRHNVSLGLGYSSPGSFFLDFAVRYTLPQKEYIIPYSDYLASTGGALPPEILSTHSNLKALLTLGWRF